MRRIWTLLVTLSRSWGRNREAVFFAVLFPIILLVIFSTAFAGGSPDFALHVQNNDVAADGTPTNLSASMIEGLESVDALSVHRIDPGQNVSAWHREEGTGTRRVLVIPAGFAAQVRNQSAQVRMTVVSDTVQRFQGQMNASQTQRVEQNLSRARTQLNNSTGPATLTFRSTPDDESASVVQGIVGSVVSEFNDRAIGVDEPTVEVRAESLSGRDLSAAAYYLPAFVGAVILINGVMTLPAVVAGLKHDGTFKRLVATPLPKRDWIAANVLHQALLGVLLTGVLVLVAYLLFGVTAVPGPLSILLVVVGSAAFASLGLTLSNFLSDPDAATSLGGAVAFPMMFLSGVFWELDVMPPTLQTVGQFMPLYHFHLGLQQLLIRNSTEGVLVPFAVLTAMALLFGALAVVTTPWTDLGD